MKNMLKDVAKWALRSSELRVDMPMSGVGIEIRRSTFVPMIENKMRRLLFFRRMFDHIKNVEGDVVECGVLYGESLLLLSFLVNDEGNKRKIWGFDAFEPLPPRTERDKAASPHKLREVTGTKIDTASVEKLLLDAGLGQNFVRSQLTLVKGYFDNTLDKFTGKAIAMLHIDVDLYNSYKRVLEEFYPQLSSGGVIVFNEYMNTYEYEYFPGAQKAINDFFAEKRSEIQRDAIAGKYYFVKT